MIEDPILIVSSAIKRERLVARLSTSELAKLAGMSKSNLSQLESGIGNPSIETLWALAQALHIPVSRLMEQPRPDVELIRWGEGSSSYADEADYAATLLSPCPLGFRRDIFTIRGLPNGARKSAAHSSGTVEHLLIIRGRALAGPTTELTEVRQGDYLCYAADVEHVFEALDTEACAVLIIEHQGR